MPGDPQLLHDAQLRPEADERRHACRREHEHHHDEREQRIALGEALVVLELVGLEPFAARKDHDTEGAERREHIHQRVVQRRAVTTGRARDEAKHDEPDIRDGGIRQQPLDIRLRERHEVADEQRENG